MTAAVLRGDARRLPLPDGSVDLICCSPPYFGLRSYVDTVKCYDCIQMEYAGRDPRQAWPDYDAHVREVHQRHYDGQIGSEASPGEWVAALVACTAEWVRVLKPSGSIFVNLGDKYAGGAGGGGTLAEWSAKMGTGTSGADYRRLPQRAVRGVPAKSLLGLPWRYALACMDELGLILRRDIIWSKPNGLPESVTDRCRSSHEYLFHFTVRPRYYAAVDEIREPHSRGEGVAPSGRGARTRAIRPGEVRPAFACGPGGAETYNPLGKLPGSVWEIPSQPLSVPAGLGVDHFAAFPMELPRRVILGWSPPGVCTECGEGRRPVTAKTALSSRRHTQSTMSVSNGSIDLRGGSRMLTEHAENVMAAITGYACACAPDERQKRGDGSASDAPDHRSPGWAVNGGLPPTRPAVVVDPFGGTGTTALVASMYGRLGFSFDLSADYCRLARWRTRDPAERARALQVPKPPPVPDGQVSLFDFEDAG